MSDERKAEDWPSIPTPTTPAPMSAELASIQKPNSFGSRGYSPFDFRACELLARRYIGDQPTAACIRSGMPTNGEEHKALVVLTELLSHIDALTTRITEYEANRKIALREWAEECERRKAAESALATARRDALEEAAKICFPRGKTYHPDIALTRVECADAIRALQQKDTAP